MEERTKLNECYSCRHKRAVPGNAHIGCKNPDPTMRGEEHGIKHGWFCYPLLFDPVWKLSDCANYQAAPEYTKGDLEYPVVTEGETASN
jgi:hypothetical protein